MGQPKITVYDHTSFEGNTKDYTTSQSELGSDFYQKVLSISTDDPDDEHKQWILFASTNFKGLSWMPENGKKYDTIPLQPVESIKLVDMRTL
jgi:hypothetical protein